MSTDQTQDQTIAGVCGILSVLEPGSPERNVGVIVVDSSNQAHLKISEALFTVNTDVLEYWSQIEEDLTNIASDLGGREMLHWLNDTGSNFLQIHSISPWGGGDADATVAALYKQHVVLSRQSKSDTTAGEVTAHKYSPADLVDAMQSLPISTKCSIQAIRTFKRSLDPLHNLEEMLKGDAVMTGQIIRLANLSKFSRGGTVRSVKQALQMVGSEAALGYVVALSLRPLYSKPSLRTIWNNSLTCRNAAGLLADRISYRGSMDVRLLALISDIGKVVLTQLEGFDKQFQELCDQGYPTLVSERILCGSDHAEVGAFLLAEWGLADDMVAAVRGHHTPSQNDSIESAILMVAEGLAGILNGPFVAEDMQTASALLGLSRADVAAVSAMLPREWDGMELTTKN